MAGGGGRGARKVRCPAPAPSPRAPRQVTANTAKMQGQGVPGAARARPEPTPGPRSGAAVVDPCILDGFVVRARPRTVASGRSREVKAGRAQRAEPQASSLRTGGPPPGPPGASRGQPRPPRGAGAGDILERAQPCGVSGWREGLRSGAAIGVMKQARSGAPCGRWRLRGVVGLRAAGCIRVGKPGARPRPLAGSGRSAGVNFAAWWSIGG